MSGRDSPSPLGHPEPGRDGAPRRVEAGPGLGSGGGGAAKGHLAVWQSAAELGESHGSHGDFMGKTYGFLNDLQELHGYGPKLGTLSYLNMVGKSQDVDIPSGYLT